MTLPFLDFAETEDRLAEIDRELMLNRRIAPDVYLGVADVTENEILVDRLLVMRRLPDDRRLATLLTEAAVVADGDDERPGRTGGVDACLRAVARTIATFHVGLPPVDEPRPASVEAVARNWQDNFEAVQAFADDVIDRSDLERARALVKEYLVGRADLFAQRIHEGFVRDGHGDLIADDIFCLDDGPRIIDCLAFDDSLRIGDVLLDIAFLVMDVERLAGSDKAQLLLDAYREFAGEAMPDSLLHHYIAYRAGVRAKVACLRHAQGDPGSADSARTHHRLMLDHLERARVRLIMVGGGPGTGKSTLARQLGDRLGLPVLVTDEIRKDITRTPRTEHRPTPPGQGIYDRATTDAAYGEMLREAELLLEQGSGAVLDASWSHARHRDDARRLADSGAAELVEFECVVDPATAKERIRRRNQTRADVSDATEEIVDHLAGTSDPWSTSTPMPTDAGPDEVLRRAVEAIHKWQRSSTTQGVRP